MWSRTSFLWRRKQTYKPSRIKSHVKIKFEAQFRSPDGGKFKGIDGFYRLHESHFLQNAEQEETVDLVNEKIRIWVTVVGGKLSAEL